MTCLHTKLIYGTISMLERMQPKDSDTDVLFIGTDRLQYFNVIWNPETKEMEAVEEAMQDNSEAYMRHSQSHNRCLVDPTGKYLAMHLWEGVLNVFRLPARRGNTAKLEVLDQIRLTELWMKTSTFIHSRTGHPRIAFLYKTQLDQEEARVAVYRLTKDDKGSDVSKFDPHKDRELDVMIQDPYASMLIPVPVHEEKRYHVRNTEGTKPHLGGLLVVGETLLTYFDSLTYATISEPMKEPKIYVSWAEYDGTHYLLADDYGRLDLLTVETSNEPTGVLVTGLRTEPMKSAVSNQNLTSRAAKMVYLGDDMLFIASHHGDAQLFNIDIESATMMLVKSFSNNGPILDFAIMDMGNREGESQLGNAFSSGQARLVAGCGAYRDGSLRSIRSGVGLENKGILDELEGTKGLFTIHSHGSQLVDTLVVSYVTETRVFCFDPDGGIEEVFEFPGLVLDTQTLLVANLPSGDLLQVTQTSVTVSDLENGVASNTWTAPAGSMITSVSNNVDWVILSIDGTTLVSLNLHNSLEPVVQDTSKGTQPDQISCLHAARDLKNVGAVGWWASGTISLVDLKTLQPLQGESLRQTEDSASVPRDMALVQLHPPGQGGPTLLVALEDGNVLTYSVDAESFALSGRKTVTLGSSPANLHILPDDDGTCSVFATTEHSSLIYSAEGRIIYSATTADEATFVVPFNSAAFPDCIILSTDTHVALCQVDRERLTHVKTLPVHETVRRVAYSPALKAFGLGCIKKELIHNEEVITSSFKLVDEIIFKELGEPFILNGSDSLEMVECVIRAELPDSAGNTAERFIVGTSFIGDNEVGGDEGTNGRILVLGVDETRSVYQIAAHNLRGCCRCLRTMGDYIVAGLSKTIVVYDYIEETTTSGYLQKLATSRAASFPVDLDVSGNFIGVADLMQSLSIVEFIPGEDGNSSKLLERARHYQQGWSTSVCNLDNDRWLEADAQGNLVVLRRNQEAPTEQDRARLETISEMNIGEQINRIRKLNVPVTEGAVVSPRAFLGSVSG